MNNSSQKLPPEVMKDPQTAYSEADLPVPSTVQNLGALQTYFTQEKVLEVVARRCQVNESEAKNIIGAAFEMIASSENPESLLKCDYRSIVTCVYQGQQMGVPIDSRKLAFPVPYYNKHKKRYEAKYEPSYQGYIYRVRKAFPDLEVYVGFVWEEDEFRITKSGQVEDYEHTPVNPFRNDYAKASGLYCYAVYSKDGERYSFCSTLPMSEVLKSREVAKQDSVWSKWFRQQCEKTAVRNAFRIKFKTLVDDLDQADNEHYDLSKPVSGTESPVSKDLRHMLDKEKADEQKNEPKQEAQKESVVAESKVTDAEYEDLGKPEDGGASDPASGTASNPSPEGQEGRDSEQVASVANQPPSESSDVAEGMQSPPRSLVEDIIEGIQSSTEVWDGKTIYYGEWNTVKQWRSTKQAYAFLVDKITASDSRDVRIAIVLQNMGFLCVLYDTDLPMLHSLLELCSSSVKQ